MRLSRGAPWAHSGGSLRVLRAAGLRAALAVAVLLCGLLIPSAAGSGNYFMALGSQVVGFDHPPVVGTNAGAFVTTAAFVELQQLAARSTAPKVAPVPAAEGSQTYSCAGHSLTLGAGDNASIDGTALAAGELYTYAGQRYLSRSALARLGLKLAFDPLEDLYRLAGKVTRIDYSADPPALTLICATPVSVEGVQEDDERITLAVEGGWLSDSAPREYAGDAYLSRLGFKSQDELGRCFVFLRQPRRTGFKIDCDPYVGYARLKFGNYFQLANWQKSSSGEISLAIQLGAPCEISTELLDGPPRLVADFSGVSYEDATRNIAVNVGRVKQLRVGAPRSNLVRVVLDLSSAADYRVLSDDGGARYFIQLLPPVERTAAPATRRLGRTVMVDAGHGGSDPGAPGVIDGTWEAPLTLAISQLLKTELEQLGYEVLLTRRSDRFTSLGARADYANTVLPYVFVSIHCNSIEKPDFAGLMTFHFATSPEGGKLAELVHAETLAATGAVDKGVRTANFFVLRETVMPSVLVECGFMTNAEECRQLCDPRYQQRLAAGIASGVDRYITGGF